MPPGIFRSSTLGAACAVSLTLLGSFFSFLFICTLYLQEVLHYSPIRASLTLLPASIVSILASQFVAPWFMNRLGIKLTVSLGMLSLLSGIALFLRTGATGDYVGIILPSKLLSMFGMAMCVPSLAVAAVFGIEPTEQGLAAGLQGTFLQAGGAADAGVFEDVASLLAHDYTVVTYDPRGNSRSPLTGEPEDQQIEVHSDDARRLLETVADGPAAVFGTSSGAIVGLDLIARHPTLVSRVVAHEPPMLEVLPDVATWRAFHNDVYDTYRREGAREALQKWAVGVGLDVAGPPPEASLPPDVAAMMKRINSNWDLFFAHELLPFTRYVPDLPRLSAHKDRIVLAGGHDSREQLAGQSAYRPAVWLAERFGTQAVDFPGDHGGYAAQPAAFAAKLREVLG